MMPNLISTLCTNRDVSVAQFQEIMAFLLSFIKADRQVEALIEKLCQRFQLMKRLALLLWLMMTPTH